MSTPKAPPLRVMTFNVRHGRAPDRANRWYERREAVFEVISGFAPHVLGAQEVDPFQLDEIADRFPSIGVIGDRRYGGRAGAYAPIFFDTHRLQAAQSGDFFLAPDPDSPIRSRRAWDAAVARICTWAVFADRSTGVRFAVFNTHLDQRGVEARLRSAELIAARLSSLSHLPRLVTTDLNANEQSEPFAVLEAAGMADTLEPRFLAPDEKTFTFHAWRGEASKGRLGKIDFVLRDDRWEVLDAEIVRTKPNGRPPSDHFPVTATLQLREPPSSAEAGAPGPEKAHS